MDGQEDSEPAPELHEGTSRSSNCSSDDTFSHDVQNAGYTLQASDSIRSQVPALGLKVSRTVKYNMGTLIWSLVISGWGRPVMVANLRQGRIVGNTKHECKYRCLEGRADTPLPAERTGAGGPVASPSLSFPGYKETKFSTAKRRYFYKGSKYGSRVGSGSSGLVEKVYWYNPDTGMLELCIAKSLNLARAAKHPDGWAGLRLNALAEAGALEVVAGVPGVVGLRHLSIRRNGPIVLIMEHVPGVALTVRIRDRGWDDVALSWQEIRTVLEKLAQVLAEIHGRKLVHGDLKPANIMNSADKTLVTLVDFGAASLWEDGWEFPGGTTVYSAPELLLSARSNCSGDAPPCFAMCTPAIDCWSYGITALELLTGCCLFAPDAVACPSDVDPKGEDAVAWTMTYTADLHAGWEESSKSHAIHIKFQEAVEQLGEVSEDFKRDGVDFLRGLLHPNPAERLTADQALLHPFLTKDFLRAAIDNRPPAVKKEVTVQSSLDREFFAALWKEVQDMKDGIDDEDEDGDEYTALPK